MIWSKTSKNFSISFSVLYKYVLTLALHQIFSDLCNGYAQCHHVRIHILFLAKISHILLKFFSSFTIKENVQTRLSGFIFQIKVTLSFLFSNHSHKILIRLFSCSRILLKLYLEFKLLAYLHYSAKKSHQYWHPLQFNLTKLMDLIL